VCASRARRRAAEGPVLSEGLGGTLGDGAQDPYWPVDHSAGDRCGAGGLGLSPCPGVLE
jgi:hypothetical protein